MISLETEEITLSDTLRRAIKFSGYTQADFANRVGVSPACFNRKLKIDGFSVLQIKTIILTLAELDALSKRQQVSTILQLAGVRSSIFSEQDWNSDPLKYLE